MLDYFISKPIRIDSGRAVDLTAFEMATCIVSALIGTAFVGLLTELMSR